MADKKIESVEVKVLAEQKTRNGAVKVRVVAWIVEGKSYVLLEKREFFEKEGQMQLGKCKGLNASEVRMILDRRAEILDAMTTPPPALKAVEAEQQKAMAQTEAQDDVQY